MNTGYLKTVLLAALLLGNVGCAGSNTTTLPIPSEAEYQRDGYLGSTDPVPVSAPAQSDTSSAQLCENGCQFDQSDKSLCYVDVPTGEDLSGKSNIQRINCTPACCEARDRDGDGIPNDKDQCPDQPEDRDGFQDDDGCPDLDNDGDGIPDAKDYCPLDPETVNGYQDDDGCPDVPPKQDANTEGSTTTETSGDVSMNLGGIEGAVVENDPNLLLKGINANLAYRVSL